MMQRGVAFLLLVALVLASVATSLMPSAGPQDALALQVASPEASPALAATPVASSPQTPVPVVLPTAAELGLVFPAGIDVKPLAVGSIDDLPADATLLRLERVTVQAGEELPTRTPSTPEVLFGELGTAMLVDAFGLSAPLPAGGQATLNAGSGYTLRNTSSGPATLLRLSIGPAAAPDPAAQVLLESQLPSLPATPASLVLAFSTWLPGADTGTYTAAGPIGLLLNSGTLTITSPSGLEAPLGSGQGLVFPANVPQRERNAGSEPAQALLIVVAPLGQPVVATVPTPTPVPTATPLPTSTPLPTATSEATATATPTATAEPTPVPTATPMPAPGETLFEARGDAFSSWTRGDGWNFGAGLLLSDGSDQQDISFAVAPWSSGSLADYAVEAEIQFVAYGAEGCSYYAAPHFGVFVRGTDEGGYLGGVVIDCQMTEEKPLVGIWPLRTNFSESEIRDERMGGGSIEIDNRWHLFRMEAEGNSLRFYIDGVQLVDVVDNRSLTGESTGVFSENVQVSVRSFRVMRLGGPITGTLADIFPSSDSSSLSGQSGSEAEQLALELLPTAGDTPPGLTPIGERQRSLPEISQAFENPGETRQLFEQWGWQENAYREFAPPNGAPLYGIRV